MEDNNRCFFIESNQYIAKIIFTNIKKGTNKLKTARIGNCSGEIKGNKQDAKRKNAKMLFMK